MDRSPSSSSREAVLGYAAHVSSPGAAWRREEPFSGITASVDSECCGVRRHTDRRGCFRPKGNTFAEPAKSNFYCSDREQAGWAEYQRSCWSWPGHRGLQHSPFWKAKSA